MFYTKYRPQKFSEISKPNDAALALANQVKSGKTVHAYLFVGPRGTGKTTTARVLAKALNCKDLGKDGDPCDECESCVAIKNGSFLDLIEIDAASNRGIDDIRQLRDKINLAPTFGKHKIYIIDEVHMLTTEAFNALLKTLEEPPKHATFILCTTEVHKIPETIKSRCEIFKFKRATIEQIVLRLSDICEKEDVKIKKDQLKKIARSASGGFRDSETILQQIIEGGLDVETFLGSTSQQSFMDFTDSLLLNDVNSAIRQINKLYDDGVDLYIWAVELTKYFRDLLFILSGSSDGLIDVTQEDFSKMEEQAFKYDIKVLVATIEAFVKASNEIKGSQIPQLPLELAVVLVCSGNSNAQNFPEDDLGPNGNSQDSPKSQSKSKNKNTIEISEVEKRWPEVLKCAVKHNHSVCALLKATKASKIEDGFLVLEVFYAFHKERLQAPKNKKVLEDVLEEVFGAPLSVKFVVSKEKQKVKESPEDLTDYNVKVANDILIDDSILNVFDGNLPM